MAEESWQIENNTRALFMRYIQITAALAEGESLRIVSNEMKRVKDFMDFGMRCTNNPPEELIPE
jgi:hypothetical protein